MEDLYIGVETSILHQFRCMYPQNFRFFTYFLNFMKIIDLICFTDFYGIIYIIIIQYSKNDPICIYSKTYMGNRQTKLFFVKTLTSNII